MEDRLDAICYKIETRENLRMKYYKIKEKEDRKARQQDVRKSKSYCKACS